MTITGGENVEEHRSIKAVWDLLLAAEMGRVPGFCGACHCWWEESLFINRKLMKFSKM